MYMHIYTHTYIYLHFVWQNLEEEKALLTKKAEEAAHFWDDEGASCVCLRACVRVEVCVYLFMYIHTYIDTHTHTHTHVFSFFVMYTQTIGGQCETTLKASRV